MEAWLAELEMETGRYHIKMDHLQSSSNHRSGTETMEAASFGEQLAAALELGFPYPHLSSESDTSSPQLELDFDYTTFIEPFTPPPPSYINNNNMGSDPLQSGASMVPQDYDHNDKDEATDLDDDGKKQQEAGTGNVGNSKKRKREPSQVMDHIIAERKRRELLSQLFISLSAIVPGLKKTDKTSVLGEAIKYLKQLQDKVKVLEEVAAKRTIESVVVVKKSQLVIDDEGVLDDGSSCTVDLPTGGGGGGGGGDDVSDESLPEIEVRVSDRTILFRIYCEKQKGTLPNLFSEIEKFDHLSIVSCGVIPFGSLALDITIVVQKEREFDKDVKDLVRTLRAALM